jgi:serine/threonine protein kinase
MPITCPACGTQNPDNSPVCASCGNPFAQICAQIALPVGTSLLNGTYKITQVLNQGGFGITYLAYHSTLKAPRVIKEFFPSQGATRTAKQVTPITKFVADYNSAKKRFIEEAQIIAKFAHENIIKVSDVWEENGTAYYVMDYIMGAKSLSQLLQDRGGTLPEGEAVDYVLQICKALEQVHQQNILHRDIKPDNILITPNRKAVLIDFGAAREFIADKTVSHSVLLTHGYAPPEQYASRAQRGPYTDIYALGATLYHLLTGTIPPSAPDRIQGAPITPPRQLNPQISEGVEKAILWSLEINAKNRPQTIKEFSDALKGTIPELGIDKIIKKAEIISLIIGFIVAALFAQGFFIKMLHLSEGIIIPLAIASAFGLIRFSAFSTLIKSQISETFKKALQKDRDSILKLIGSLVALILIVSIFSWAAPLTILSFPAITAVSSRFFKDRLRAYLEHEGGSDSAKTMALVQLLSPVGVLTLVMLLLLALF